MCLLQRTGILKARLLNKNSGEIQAPKEGNLQEGGESYWHVASSKQTVLEYMLMFYTHSQLQSGPGKLKIHRACISLQHTQYSYSSRPTMCSTHIKKVLWLLAFPLPMTMQFSRDVQRSTKPNQWLHFWRPTQRQDSSAPIDRKHG